MKHRSNYQMRIIVGIAIKNPATKRNKSHTIDMWLNKPIVHASDRKKFIIEHLDKKFSNYTIYSIEVKTRQEVIINLNN